MPRPRIGKVPHWDNISPSEAKELRKLEERKKKFGVVRQGGYYLTAKSDGNYEHEYRTYVRVIEEAPNLVYNGEKLVSGVTLREARMWANMMQ